MRSIDLTPHPATSAPDVRGISVGLAVESARLTLSYLVDGNIPSLRVPVAAEPRRSDGLWRHTCFEIFLRQPAIAGYVELNFSPSSEWAAYGFDGYRSGMQPLELSEPPRIATRADASTLRIDVEVLLPTRYQDSATLHAGLSAVIESRSGDISYWALAHPAARADFHHEGGFMLELPLHDPGITA